MKKVVRLIFDNLVFETELETSGQPDALARAVRACAGRYGVAGAENLKPLLTIADGMGLYKAVCAGFEVDVMTIYADDRCQILAVRDERDRKKMMQVDKSAPTDPNQAPSPPQTERAGPEGNPIGSLDFSLMADATLGYSDFTLETWLFPTALDEGPGQPVSRRPEAGRAIIFHVRDQRPYFSFGRNALLGSIALKSSAWCHLAWRFQARERKLAMFTDGELDEEIQFDPEAPSELTFGTWLGGRAFGHVGEIRFHYRALDEAQLRAAADREPDPPVKPGADPPAPAAAPAPSAAPPAPAAAPVPSAAAPAPNAEATSPAPAAAPAPHTEAIRSAPAAASQPGPETLTTAPNGDRTAAGPPAGTSGQPDDPIAAAAGSGDAAPAQAALAAPAPAAQVEPVPGGAVGETATSGTAQPPLAAPPSGDSPGDGVSSGSAGSSEGTAEPAGSAAGDNPAAKSSSQLPESAAGTHVLVPAQAVTLTVAPETRDRGTLTLLGQAIQLVTKNSEAGVVLSLAEAVTVSASDFDFFGAFSLALTLTVERALVSFAAGKPALDADLRAALPADRLNQLIPTDAIAVCETFSCNLTVDSTGKVTLQPRNLPLVLKAAGASSGDDPQRPGSVLLDFGEYGAISITLPAISLDGSEWRATGTITLVRPLRFPLTFIRTLCQKLGLATAASLVPDQVGMTDEPAGPANSTDPPGLVPYLGAALPDSLHFAFQYISGAGFLLDFFTPEEAPVRLVLRPPSPARLGVKLWGLGFGAIADQLNLTIDAETELFLTGDAPPGDAPSFKLRTRETVILFCGNPSVGYLPVPVFFEKLGVLRQGSEGMQLAADCSFPMPALTDAAPLIRQLKEYFNEPDALVWGDALGHCDLTIALAGAYLRLPGRLGGLLLGAQGTIAQLSGAEAVTELLNLFKVPNLNPLLDLLPVTARAGADALVLFFGNADLNWATTAPDSFLQAVTGPAALTQAANSGQLSMFRPLPDLLTSLFGAAAATGVAGATAAAEAAAHAAENVAPAVVGAGSEPLEKADEPNLAGTGGRL